MEIKKYENLIKELNLKIDKDSRYIIENYKGKDIYWTL
jgi:hypothetical protein